MTEEVIAPYLILTRAGRQAHRFARELRMAGLTGSILFSPVLEIATLPPAAALPAGILIFTSENGVWAAATLGLRGKDGSALAVGERTAQAARHAGFECRAAGRRVSDIAALIAREGMAGPFLHLHGCHVTGDLAARLRKAGHEAASVAIYDQVPRALSAAAVAALLHRDTVLPLFSSRSATLVAQALPRRPAHVSVVALSTAVAAAWPWDDPLDVAAEPTSAAMVAALRRLVARRPER